MFNRHHLDNLDKRKGFILIIVVGTLCVLTLLTITFNVVNRLELQSAKSFDYSIKARYLAEAGINKAIAALKSQAKSDFIWDVSDSWYTGYSDNTLMSGSGTYNVSIIDCQSQINLNDTGNSNLARMLQHLKKISYQEAQDIIEYRDNTLGGAFETKEQIRQVPGVIDKNESYDDFKDNITVYSYINTSNNRAPININTAPKRVLEGVLCWVIDSDEKGGDLADEIIARRQNNPFDDWKEFDDFIDTVTTSPNLTSDEREDIKNNCNPNREKPDHYTTEFSFHSGGYFEIESTGNYYDSAGKLTASKKIEVIAKIFDIKYDTTKEDFEQGTCWKVNYWNNCPVVSTEDHTASDFSDNGWDQGPSNYTTISDSLKLGFWEDFDEDYPANPRTYWNSREGATFEIGNYSTYSDGNELYMNGDGLKVIDLGTSDSKWQWPDASFRAWTEEERDDDGDGNPAPSYYVAYILSKVQNFGEDDYTLCQKKENWGWVGHDFDATEWELPTTAEAVYQTDTQYRPYKAKKMVVSEDKVDVYRNDMLTAISENKNVQIDYLFGTFGAWGRNDDPVTYDPTLIKIDNIRIIPMSPDEDGNYAHYDSVVFAAGETVEGGAVGATVTIPASASSASEKVFLQMKTGGNDWQPASVETIESQGGTTVSAGSGIQYRVDFESLDNRTHGTKPYFSETPVVEDVTLIYLPETKILYYRELSD